MVLKVYGVELTLPEGKLPGYYAQIVKGIADSAPLIDRDKTLLFVATAEDASSIEAFAARYKAAAERGEWIALDDTWSADDGLFTDFGVVTRSGRHFIDAGLGAIVALSGEEENAELEQAMLQAEEFAFARKREKSRQLLAVGRHHAELLHGIAHAYRCKAETLL